MATVNFLLPIFWSIFLLTNRPVQKIMSLCLSLISVMFFVTYLNKMPWFSMVFAMLMISGLMILFFYMGSIQHSTSQNLSYSLKYHCICTLMLYIFMPWQNSFCHYPVVSLNIFNSFNSNMWIIILFLLLLIFMLINLELITNFNSPLRAKTSSYDKKHK